jgi:hypothetical protein
MLQIKPADEAAFDSLLDAQAYEQTLSEQGS